MLINQETILKIIVVILMLFTGFVCGGTYATKRYAERVDTMQRYTDKVTDDTKKLAEDLLVCRTTLKMGQNL